MKILVESRLKPCTLHLRYVCTLYISSQLFENQFKENWCHLCEKASKGRFLGPISSKITLVKEKERRKRKRGSRKKGGDEKKKQWLHW